jgi:hypothetical protein
MSRIRLLMVVALAVLLMATGSYAVMADDPQPEVSAPVVTETSHVEWVTRRSQTGQEVREPVTVHEITTAETVNIPRKESHGKAAGEVTPLSDQESPGGVNVTLERAMSWYQDGQLWRVWSKGRTYTTSGTCTGGCNIYAEHQYQSGSTWYESAHDQKLSSGPCHSDSTLAQTAASLFYSGTWHRTYGLHVVYVSGVRYPYDRYGPGPLQVP